MPTLPGPIRAAVGLAATAVEQARTLPERAIELPMLAVSTALQLSLRAQQRYAQLAARGDDLLNGRVTTDDPPPWATFDPPVDLQEHARTRSAAAETVPEISAGDIDVETDEDLESDEATPKPVRARRDAAPSRFDAVGDES